MLKTASVTQLRAELAAYLERVGEGPVVVVSRSRPAAVLLDPQVYEALVETAYTLEDVLDGLAGLERYASEPGSAVDAEEVFARLGHP
jgi:prevent-host-death family protein